MILPVRRTGSLSLVFFGCIESQTHHRMFYRTAAQHRPFFGANHIIETAGDLLLLRPIGFANQAFPAIANDSVASFFGNGHTQSGRLIPGGGKRKQNQRLIGCTRALVDCAGDIIAADEALLFTKEESHR